MVKPDLTGSPDLWTELSNRMQQKYHCGDIVSHGSFTAPGYVIAVRYRFGRADPTLPPFFLYGVYFPDFHSHRASGCFFLADQALNGPSGLSSLALTSLKIEPWRRLALAVELQSEFAERLWP